MGQHACCQSDLCQLCHWSFTGEFFSFRVVPPTNILCWCYIVYFLLSDSDVVTNYTSGVQPLCLHHHNPSEYIHGRHICLQVLVHGPCQKCTEYLIPSYFDLGVFHATQTAVGWPFNLWWAYGFGAQQSHPSYLAPYMVGRDLFRVWFNLVAQMTLNVNIKPGGSGVMGSKLMNSLTPGRSKV